MDAKHIALNKEIEAKWRKGEISDTAFLWWLMHVCGV